MNRKPLGIGDAVPVFSLKNQNGNLISIEKFQNHTEIKTEEFFEIWKEKGR
jgi:hypothetical protein